MIRTLISIGVTFVVAVLAWVAISILAPSMNYEKALVIIVYPSIAAGIITALIWKPKRRPG